jgi:DNA mismatch endonuclease, patch repair protein
MDRISEARRSWNMARIRSRNTKPEIKVRSILHRMGFRFRINVIDIPGKPDVVLPKYHSIILVHGCFWHRHPGCRYAYTPKSRIEFWENKFQDNIKRDEVVLRQLNESGWHVLRIWECEINNSEDLISRLILFLKPNYPARWGKQDISPSPKGPV